VKLRRGSAAFATLYNNRVSMEALQIASEACGVSVSALMTVQRSKNHVAFARQLAMYLCHVVGGMSLRDVARELERDRTTVGHACHMIEDKRDDEIFDKQLNMLECELRKRVKDIDESDLLPFDGLEQKNFKFAI